MDKAALETVKYCRRQIRDAIERNAHYVTVSGRLDRRRMRRLDLGIILTCVEVLKILQPGQTREQIITAAIQRLRKDEKL